MNRCDLPPDLQKTAASVEKRFRMLSVPTRRVAPEEWEALPKEVRAHVPAWIPRLLADYSLVDGVLEWQDLHRPGLSRLFALHGPDEYARVLLSGDEILKECILDLGCVPISHEQNGDFWVATSRGDASSPISIFSLTGLDITPVSRLSLLLQSMEISDYNF